MEDDIDEVVSLGCDAVHDMVEVEAEHGQRAVRLMAAVAGKRGTPVVSLQHARPVYGRSYIGVLQYCLYTMQAGDVCIE